MSVNRTTVVGIVVLNAVVAAAQTLGDCTIRTIAGPAITDAGDGGPAEAAQLLNPSGAASDSAGNIYIADSGNQKIRKISPDGIITTFAGIGLVGSGENGGPASSAALSWPSGPAVGPDGSIYFVERTNHRVRRIAGDGMIRTVAGTGVGGFSGDGGPATAADLFIPLAVAVDAAGDLFIADYGNHRVRRVDAETGIITTLAGSDPFGGFTDVLADGSKATSVPLLAQGLALDASGNLLVASHDAIVKITADGIFHVVAGTRDGFGRPLDGARALSTAVPADTLAIDSSGTIYFSGSNNVDSGIWSIGTDGIIHPVVPYTVATSLATFRRKIEWSSSLA